MGGERQAAPGKTSGVTADDLARAPSIGAVAPGPSNLVHGHDTGVQWIDHGAVCDGKDQATKGCFYSEARRLREIIDFKDRVRTAATNYKNALAELQVAELMKKEDDLHWVLSLALDVLGAHLLVVAASALKSVRTAEISKLVDIADRAAYLGSYSESAWSSRAEGMLRAVSDSRIDTFAKAGFDLGKKGATKGMQALQNHADQTAKQATLSYIDQLKNGCDVAFERFEKNAIGHSTDAELLVLWKGMDPKLHTPGAYKAALGAKIERFRNSGVPHIGRKTAYDREFGQANVHHDTRVVFVQDMNGGKTAWYQSQQSDYNPGVIKPCDPGSEAIPLARFTNAKCEFGSRHPREARHLERRVPEEFTDVAIARSEQRWGPIETVDDPFVSHMKSLGQDVTKWRQKNTPAAPSLPANSIFAQQPEAAGSQASLPADSIFALAMSNGPEVTP